MNASSSLKLWFGLCLCTSVSAQTPLVVGVAGGFSDTFSKLIPSLSKQLGQPISMQPMAVSELSQAIRKPHSVIDLMINGGSITSLEQQAKEGYIQPQSVRLLATTPIVLWCPNPQVQLRVSINDTLHDSHIKAIAVSRPDSPVGQSIARLSLPPHIRLHRTPHSLASWRMVRQKQADCAFTLLNLMRSGDHYQQLKDAEVPLFMAIPRNSTQAKQAQKAILLLSTPLMQARIRSYGFY